MPYSKQRKQSTLLGKKQHKTLSSLLMPTNCLVIKVAKQLTEFHFAIKKLQC